MVIVNIMGRFITIDYEKVEEYIQANHCRQTMKEMTACLNEMGIKISYVTLLFKIKEMGITPMKDKACRPPTLDHKKIDEYVRINHEYETAKEMSAFLAVDIGAIYDALRNNNLRAYKPILKRKKTIEQSMNKQRSYVHLPKQITPKRSASDIDYWPSFEDMDERWHDALINILAAAHHEDGRNNDEGSPEWEERKARMKASRPKAEYDQIVTSSIIKEELSLQGYHVK